MKVPVSSASKMRLSLADRPWIPAATELTCALDVASSSVLEAPCVKPRSKRNPVETSGPEGLGGAGDSVRVVLPDMICAIATQLWS